ncbi:MAG: ABC transporter ATP-binding protein [Azorhizobium sp. 32-67-21]|nr:MAG: ABC transporter ATP-binding protein [Azorhizobium sp. 32-67-21]OYY10258.1 MAG: ABC transporter ATP-binding protein [Rhizobiales bacterium 35-68-8]
MENILSIRGLTKRFGGLAAVDGVDLDFPNGRLNAVIGPNGAGKTTLFNLITGMLSIDGGQVVFDGDNIAGLKPHRIVARGLSRTLQIKSVFSGLTVADNLRVAVMAHEKIASPFRSALGFSGVNRRVEELLVETGLARLSGRVAGTLSYGDVALLEIALALANRPRLLLLDEPICGMSPAETETTVARIVALSKTTQIILIEHDMEVVFAIADLITVMAAGRVLARGTPKEIAENKEVQDAYLGAPEDPA